MRPVSGRTAKACWDCGEEKPVLEFHRRTGRGDGYNDQCKQCRSRAQKSWTPEQRMRAYAVTARVRGKPEVKEAVRVYMKEYQRKPEVRAKYKARNAVATAIRNGSMVRPMECSSCGATEKLQAHHSDYSRPLDVTWVCRSCHSKHHSNRLVLSPNSLDSVALG